VQGDVVDLVKPRLWLQLSHKGVIRLGQQAGFDRMKQLRIGDIQPVLGEIAARLIYVTLMELILGHAVASSVQPPWLVPEEKPEVRSLRCA
jgi:hypothetical protein